MSVSEEKHIIHLLLIQSRDDYGSSEVSNVIMGTTLEKLAQAYEAFLLKHQEADDWMEVKDLTARHKELVTGVAAGHVDESPELNSAYILQYTTTSWFK